MSIYNYFTLYWFSVIIFLIYTMVVEKGKVTDEDILVSLVFAIIPFFTIISILYDIGVNQVNRDDK